MISLIIMSVLFALYIFIFPSNNNKIDRILSIIPIFLFYIYYNWYFSQIYIYSLDIYTDFSPAIGISLFVSIFTILSLYLKMWIEPAAFKINSRWLNIIINIGYTFLINSIYLAYNGIAILRYIEGKYEVMNWFIVFIMEPVSLLAIIHIVLSVYYLSQSRKK